MHVAALFLMLAWLSACALGRTITVSTASAIRDSTPRLAAGDTLRVAAGTYDMPTWNVAGISGEDTRPIVIMAAGAVAIRGTSGSANLVQVSNVHYLVFKGFEICMRDNYDGIDGINIRGSYNSHITMENLYIHDMTNAGIGMWPDSTAYVTLRNSEIGPIAGSGLYWGYPGRNIIHDVLIEGNYIHDCPRDSLQDTHYGIQWKGWCFRAVIQNNVLHDVGGTTRCGIVVYYGRRPLAGDNTADMNIVRGNVVWNCRNEGITAMSDALIENNIVFDAGVGINLQTYGDESFTGSNHVENLVVRNNTVFRCRTRCVNIGGWSSAGANVSFSANAAYQEVLSKPAIGGGVGTGTSAGNVYYGTNSLSQGAVQGNGLADFLSANGAAVPPDLDFYPSSSSALVGALRDAAACAAIDFNGTVRPQGVTFDAGAYERTTDQNPGWSIQKAKKVLLASIRSPRPAARASDRAAGAVPITVRKRLLPSAGVVVRVEPAGREFTIRGEMVGKDRQ